MIYCKYPADEKLWKIVVWKPPFADEKPWTARERNAGEKKNLFEAKLLPCKTANILSPFDKDNATTKLYKKENEIIV